MPQRASWIDLTSQQQQELDRCIQPAGWKIVPGAVLPSVFAPFQAKIVSALLVAEHTSTGGTYLAFSAERLDRKDAAIDIEPFGIIVHSTGSGPSGVFIHHGNWEGRTIHPTGPLWDEISRSGVADYFLTTPPHGLREGPLEQLPKGHRGALDALIREIRVRE